MVEEGTATRGAPAAALYPRVVAGFLDRVEAVPLAAWNHPTPCEGWTVRDLVAHVVIVHRRVLARFHGGEVPDIEPSPPTPGEDLPADLRTLVAAVQKVLSAPDQASRQVDSIIGQLSFGELVGTLLCSDLLLHTWDLARATGQDERLDPEAVAEAMRFLHPRDEQLRAPGEFGPRSEPPPGSDEQAALIAFSGRRV